MPYLIAMEDGCEIHYCLLIEKLMYDFIKIRLPPFHRPPKQQFNSSTTLAILGLHGETWVKNNDGEWEETSVTETGRDLLASFGIYAKASQQIFLKMYTFSGRVAP